MPLFIPTSNLLKSPELAGQYVAVGELYNLDDNKKICFQFNPEEYEIGRTYNWADLDSVGAPSNHYNYISQKDVLFELQLLFIADIGTPPVTTEGGVSPLITPKNDVVVDFDELCNELFQWLEEREAEGRPSFLRIFIGKDSLTGFVKGDLKKRVLDLFPGGTEAHPKPSARRGLLTMQFQPWAGVSS